MKERLGYAIVAVLFAVSLVFLSCESPATVGAGRGGSGDDLNGSTDVYTVTVKPGSMAIIANGSSDSTASLMFKAYLYKNGQKVDSAVKPSWAVTYAAASKHSDTAINTYGVLTVAAGETSETLTVSAAITYNDNIYTGTASVSLVTAAVAFEALQTIKNAANSDTLLDALKTPKAV